jgi:hypothetical protein
MTTKGVAAVDKMFSAVMALVKIGKAAEMLGVDVQTLRA